MNNENQHMPMVTGQDQAKNAPVMEAKPQYKGDFISLAAIQQHARMFAGNFTRPLERVTKEMVYDELQEAYERWSSMLSCGDEGGKAFKVNSDMFMLEMADVYYYAGLCEEDLSPLPNQRYNDMLSFAAEILDLTKLTMLKQVMYGLRVRTLQSWKHFPFGRATIRGNGWLGAAIKEVGWKLCDHCEIDLDGLPEAKCDQQL